MGVLISKEWSGRVSEWKIIRGDIKGREIILNLT